MFDKDQNKRKLIEIASIAGIMASFFWVEKSLGLVNWISNEFVASVPILKDYGFNIVCAAFLGLATYSIMQRLKARQELNTRRLLEEIIKQKDFIDTPTGLSNRIGFKLMLSEMRKSEVMASKSIIAFEIRNLDTIASVHGEAVVAKIESLYADKLKDICGKHDFAGRPQRGRFYLLLTSPNQLESNERTQKALAAVREVSIKGFKVNNISMSVQTHLSLLDLSMYEAKACEWDEEDILRRLDYVLFIARNEAYDKACVYSDEMEKSLSLRGLIESELLDALRAGEIVPFFQPFINLKTNRVEGFEILSRWHHPREGFIMPDLFVSIAEDIGAMQEFSLTMLEKACFAARNWPDAIKLSFNISPTELRSETMMDGFFDILKQSGFSAERIEIEITENAFIDEVGEITEAVARLKKHGVQISIDDFGTGFANFSHLKILPFDKIKIDKSFVLDMGHNENSRVIVQNIIALGKSMGLPTVAEGIEMLGDLDTLNELGCSIGQGYLYAKALDADSVPTFLNNFANQTRKLAAVA